VNESLGHDVEVCIVAFGNRDLIAECIVSLRTLGRRVSVALCDNHADGSTVNIAEAAARSVELDLRTIARPDNPGFAVACNQLAANSRAEWLLFLNPDASVVRWPGIEVMRVGITGPRIVGPSGRRQYSYGRRRTIVDEVVRRLQVRPRVPRGVGYVSGAAILIPRADFEIAGGFDEAYFMYYEDIDLCRRVVEAGGEVRLDDSFVVQHVGAYSASSDPSATAMRSYRSARIYYQKWTGTTTWIDLVVLVDSAVRVTLGSIRLPIPGAFGSRATLREAWSHLRSRTPDRPPSHPR
jgi:N-acetylglucosaminyl-diphospho-decaprenol L-rhamnosyltransferase